MKFDFMRDEKINTPPGLSNHAYSPGFLEVKILANVVARIPTNCIHAVIKSMVETIVQLGIYAPLRKLLFHVLNNVGMNLCSIEICK